MRCLWHAKIMNFTATQNIELALEALYSLNAGTPHSKRCRLVVAGGYDERLPQARSYMAHLLATIECLQLQDQVPCISFLAAAQSSPSHRSAMQ